MKQCKIHKDVQTRTFAIHNDTYSNKCRQLMIDEYKRNPKCFEILMSQKFPHQSIKQALGYKTISRFNFAGVDLGFSFSNKVYDTSNHAEDAICDFIEILFHFPEKLELIYNISEEIFNQITTNIQRGNLTLFIEISASPCTECTQRLIDLIKNYNIQIYTAYDHLYRNPDGGIEKSMHNLSELEKNGAHCKTDDTIIQR